MMDRLYRRIAREMPRRLVLAATMRLWLNVSTKHDYIAEPQLPISEAVDIWLGYEKPKGEYSNPHDNDNSGSTLLKAARATNI